MSDGTVQAKVWISNASMVVNTQGEIGYKIAIIKMPLPPRQIEADLNKRYA